MMMSDLEKEIVAAIKKAASNLSDEELIKFFRDYSISTQAVPAPVVQDDCQPRRELWTPAEFAAALAASAPIGVNPSGI
jgi:hypothetical protein